MSGRVPSGRALTVPVEPASSLAPSGFDPSRGFLIKAYRVHVDGFSGQLYYAASRGKALRDAWYAYCSHWNVSFKEWLRIARCYREWPTDPDFGAPITHDGKPAFFITRNVQYVQFARPFEPSYGNAHPFEIEPQRFRPEAYRDRDRSGEADETQRGSAEGKSPDPKGIAQ